MSDSDPIQAVPTRPCRACGVRIFFSTIIETNRSCPFDAEPAADGKYVVGAWGLEFANGQKQIVSMAKYDPREDDGSLRYHSHFTTCTNPSQFSRKGTHANRR
jgi:hypothetical protein